MTDEYIPISQVFRALADGREVTVIGGVRFRLNGDRVEVWNFNRKEWIPSVHQDGNYSFLNRVVKIG